MTRRAWLLGVWLRPPSPRGRLLAEGRLNATDAEQASGYFAVNSRVTVVCDMRGSEAIDFANALGSNVEIRVVEGGA